MERSSGCLRCGVGIAPRTWEGRWEGGAGSGVGGGVGGGGGVFAQSNGVTAGPNAVALHTTYIAVGPGATAQSKTKDAIAIGDAAKSTADGATAIGAGSAVAAGDALLYDPARNQESPAQENEVAGTTPSARLSGILEKAETMIGVPYSWGGNTPAQGLDCSGFVRYVYAKAVGILLPRVSSQISRQGAAVSQTDLHPGDLVFFNTTRGTATHVGIYVGENQFIHAPKKGAFVRVESMKSAYWTARYYGARRVA